MVTSGGAAIVVDLDWLFVLSAVVLGYWKRRSMVGAGKMVERYRDIYCSCRVSPIVITSLHSLVSYQK